MLIFYLKKMSTRAFKIKCLTFSIESFMLMFCPVEKNSSVTLKIFIGCGYIEDQTE